MGPEEVAVDRNHAFLRLNVEISYVRNMSEAGENGQEAGGWG